MAYAALFPWLRQDEEVHRIAATSRKIKNNVEQTETRTAAPVGPIGQARRTPMALSTLLVLLCLLGFIALAAWFTISVQQRTSQPLWARAEASRGEIPRACAPLSRPGGKALKSAASDM